MKYTIITLGCKVNSYESSYLKESFDKEGYTFVSLEDNPDVVVINTCSVTNQSDAKSRHMIRNARKTCKDAVIVACGCSVQNKQDELKGIGADILIGNFGKRNIPTLVKEYLDKKDVKVDFDVLNEFEEMKISRESDKTRAFVKVQDGCNNFCTYCIIPYIRGRIRSKKLDVCVNEIKELVNNGHREIVLTGIDTGSYGKDLDINIVTLIKEISKIKGLERIRISSVEIMQLDDEFLEELKNNKKLVNHLHVPLQSGSDEILKYMNRKYDTSTYYKKIEKIRSIRKDISITTDLIVGFPHEDEKCFNETYEFLKKCAFTKIHTFPYSVRTGTAAAKMTKYFVNDKVKKERVKKVIELSDEMEENYYKKFIGKTLEVVVESDKNGITRGHTDNYILVELDKKYKEGDIVQVVIDSVDGKTVKGHVVDVEK